MVRHFTVTGFVAYQGKTVLHWHRKLGMWLPPGGHIEPGEDPVQAVLREIREETGLEAEVLPAQGPLPFSRPLQLPPPVTILVEDIPDPDGTLHQHIDLIYFCRPRSSVDFVPVGSDDMVLWVDEKALGEGAGFPVDGHSQPVRVPEDVRLLALEAIAAERRCAGGP